MPNNGIIPSAYVYSGNNYHPQCIRDQLKAEYAWGEHSLWGDVDVHELLEFVAYANGSVFEEDKWDNSLRPEPRYRIANDEICSMCKRDLVEGLGAPNPKMVERKALGCPPWPHIHEVS